MIPVILTKIKTRDGVTLDGIYVKPKRKGDIALIWLHGLSSRFSSGQALIKELSSACSKNGIGYFKFNNRGHDIVARGPKKFIGTAFEKFEDCILDIRAMVRFARKLGYRNIILAGHSTGANKTLYYTYKTRDISVKKLVLAGAISDIAIQLKLKGKAYLKRGLAIAQRLKNKDPYAIMPKEFGFTASRFISLYEADRNEDVFPYYNPKGRWKELRSVKIPVAVILGSRDEGLDRPAKKLIEIFRQNAKLTKLFSGIIIKGADHGFRGKEKELAQHIIKFIKEIEADRRGSKHG